MSLLSCAHPALVPASKHLSLNYFGTLSMSDIFGHRSPSSVRVAYVVPGKQPGSLRRVPFASWNTSAIRYVHSFAVSKTHALFVFPPVTWNEEILALSLEIGPAMVWNASQRMQIVAVPLSGISADGQVTQQPVFMASMDKEHAFFPLHMTNAWNSECSASDLQTIGVSSANCSRLHFEGAGYGDLSVINMFMMDTVHNTTAMNEQDLHLNFKRFSIAVPTSIAGSRTVHLDSSLVSVQDFKWKWRNGLLVPGPTLPRWNREWGGQRTCFVWGLQSHVNGSRSYADQAVLKFDTCAYEAGDAVVHAVFTRSATMFAEPVFIPRPGAVAEDDGVVLVDTYDTVKHLSSLHILDGHSLDVLAVLDAPILVPFPVHAEWFADE